MNNSLFLLLLGFKMSNKCCAVLFCITQAIRVQVTEQIYTYIFHCICYTTAKHLASVSLQRQFTCHSTRGGMWEVCTVCYPGSAIVENIPADISTTQTADSKKSIFLDSTSSSRLIPHTSPVFAYFGGILHSMCLHNKILSCHIL